MVRTDGRPTIAWASPQLAWTNPPEADEQQPRLDEGAPKRVASFLRRSLLPDVPGVTGLESFDNGGVPDRTSYEGDTWSFQIHGKNGQQLLVIVEDVTPDPEYA